MKSDRKWRKKRSKNRTERKTRNQAKVWTKQQIAFPFVGYPGKQRL